MICIHIYTYIYTYIYMVIKRQLFSIDTGYYWYLNIHISNLQSCYETPEQNKKEENFDIIKVLILLRLFLKFI